MKEYKEALDAAQDVFEYNNLHGLPTLTPDQFNLLKKLVDRETPLKPISGTLCGNCKSPLFINSFRYRRCLNSKCEQKADWSIDWGKDNE